MGSETLSTALGGGGFGITLDTAVTIKMKRAQNSRLNFSNFDAGAGTSSTIASIAANAGLTTLVDITRPGIVSSLGFGGGGALGNSTAVTFTQVKVTYNDVVILDESGRVMGSGESLFIFGPPLIVNNLAGNFLFGNSMPIAFKKLKIEMDNTAAAFLIALYGNLELTP